MNHFLQTESFTVVEIDTIIVNDATVSFEIPFTYYEKVYGDVNLFACNYKVLYVALSGYSNVANKYTSVMAEIFEQFRSDISRTPYLQNEPKYLFEVAEIFENHGIKR